MTIRIIITGCRDWQDYGAVRCALEAFRDSLPNRSPGDFVLVHGDAKGADRIAADVASGFGWRLEPHPANWIEWGASAGPRRNAEMVSTGAHCAYAFWDGLSRGTLDCLSRLVRAGIPVRIVPKTYGEQGKDDGI